MSGVDLLEKALPYVLPLALTAVTALVSPALITPRRLRQELATDVVLVERLPTRERADLSQDIKRRARHLIAMTRYPPVTLYDLLALLGLTTIVVLVTLGQIAPMADKSNEVLISPLGIGLPAIFAASCWGAFYAPWATRAKGSLEHIHEHLGDVEAQEAARTVRIAYFAALLAGPGVIFGMQLATAVVVSEETRHDWRPISLAIIGGVIGLAVTYILSSRVKLYDTLLEFDQRHQEERQLILEQELKRRRKKQERHRSRGDVQD